MRDKIDEILNLVKNNNFVEAGKKCEDIKNKLDNNLQFLHIYGFVSFNLKDYNKAIDLWQETIKIDPNFLSGLNNLGNALSKIQKFEEAIGYLNKSLEIKPDFFETHYTLSEIFFQKGLHEKSLHHLNEAIKVKPDHLQTIKNKLKLLLKLNKREETLEFLEKVIPHHAKNTELYNEKAQVLSELGLNTQSLNTYKTIFMLDPDFPFVLGNIVSDKLRNCNWDGLDKDLEDIKKKINKEKEVADPFLVSTLFDSSDLLNKSTKIWIKQFDHNQKTNKFQVNRDYSKTNIGYYSADFRDHPVGHLIVKMIECHDKSKFNIYGFYLGNKHKKNDEYHLRLKKAFTKFYDVSKMSDEEISSLSKDIKVHIAIDLMAHTGGHESRFGIFLKKCAPIQINFLGYPGTSASDKIDYIIADRTVIPEKNKKFFSEKIIYLPNSYQPSEKDRRLSNKKVTKQSLNLPDDNFIFCCFNTNSKILPNTVRLWTDILKKVPKSILWLISDKEDVKKNLKLIFKKENIEPKRIIFSDKVHISEHLLRIKYADLFLDTFPYNAHTSCSDSIWVGLPVLTLEGDSFQSRVASSLLKTSGLDELIAKNKEEYIEKAVHIAQNKEHLNYLKKKLILSRDSNPLFDNKSFTNNIEKAYLIALEKYLNKEDPDDIYL
tara:strand:- start:3090 stop:5066 length:1977 start_codon:yes stop_codon:yes gene_type:complete